MSDQKLIQQQLSDRTREKIMNFSLDIITKYSCINLAYSDLEKYKLSIHNMICNVDKSLYRKSPKDKDFGVYVNEIDEINEICHNIIGYNDTYDMYRMSDTYAYSLTYYNLIYDVYKFIHHIHYQTKFI